MERSIGPQAGSSHAPFHRSITASPSLARRRIGQKREGNEMGRRKEGHIMDARLDEWLAVGPF